MKEIAEIIAREIQADVRHVENTLKLLDEGATIPFISRYRKEATGGMTDVQVTAVANSYERLLELQHRKEYVLHTIEEQGKLTAELRQRIRDCWEAQTIEDIYLPFKPKRRTRAEVARQKGLEPLADKLLLHPGTDPTQAARAYLSKEVPDIETALQGARDIIAERVSEDEASRNTVRALFRREAVIRSRVVKGKESEAAKYRDYFDHSEPLRHCSSHRLLAMRRGENEGLLRVSIAPEDDTEVTCRLSRRFTRHGLPAAAEVEAAVTDAYRRLLRPSIETEFATASKQSADAEAIRVFAGNLRQLLLAPPLGQRRLMGIDPGFRTGCKVVCLDSEGNLLHHDVIYPHPPRNEFARSSGKLRDLVEEYHIEAVAIGNGTAGRETEELLRSLHIEGLGIFLVSEDGASVYSASKVGREEFPDEDVTVRGAVSIARRLADPLAELVKIDPKSIGVGQYQHDVDAGALKQSLDRTVESCVNSVGVNLNTASAQLLTYVSGLGAALAQKIVDFRRENGPFRSRRDLLRVPRLGAKAYEQCAGFLRIPDAENPLDNTAVHPERYALVGQMAADAGCDIATLIASPDRRKALQPQRYRSAEVGMPTLLDIMTELDKPGRDPRGTAKEFEYDEGLHSIDDLDEGMTVTGVVTNITNFGCFVDLGIKTKGLVHVSKLCNRYVKDPTEVVNVRQRVRCQVIAIDYERGRISLSMKGVEQSGLV